MQRHEINPHQVTFPRAIQPYIVNSRIFDSSSSPQARVYYADHSPDRSYFIKTAAAQSLCCEAAWTTYFHARNLAPDVLYYGTIGERDWLVTARIPGEDCTSPQYMADPDRLVPLLAHRLRALHETDYSDCPETTRMERYVQTVQHGYRDGRCDRALYTTWYGEATDDEIYRIARDGWPRLRADVLLHGDYCLPNVILDDWKFSGFVDLDCAGIGDRHVDVYWALWTLQFNLHTNDYRSLFIREYGADLVDEEMLRIVAAMEVFG